MPHLPHKIHFTISSVYNVFFIGFFKICAMAPMLSLNSFRFLLYVFLFLHSIPDELQDDFVFFYKLKNEQKLIEEESKSSQPHSTTAISERNSTSSSDAVQLKTDTKPQCSSAVEEVCQLINEGENLRKHNRDLQCLNSEITNSDRRFQ
ncbi:hypothetical protein T03_13049 [Trichinella britovi]|uniref:Uncharacterized protein n=1 Tax=Trichinella britovi TaxID=45882 RepID=A0A0V1D5D9_TRIBR|nr:hypothetical protein T03_13049 [Trichinella britovi]